MSQLLVKSDGRVTVITLNRPHRLNAMTPGMFALLETAWRAADEDPACRAIIVTGADGNFSSGMDLKAVAGEPGEENEPDLVAATKADPGLPFRALLKTWRPAKPVIAAVEGVAIGGGTELLLGSDIRIAGETARFGLSEVRWSLYPAAGGPVRLPRQIPYAAASELLLTGRHVLAPEAYRLGLVGRVVPAGEALAAAREVAGQIASNGPLAVAAILRTLRETYGMSEADAFAFEQPLIEELHASADSREGPRAFAEKRPARYLGK